MKKTYLIIFLILVMASQCFAFGDNRVIPSYWKTWTVRNETGTYSHTSVSTDIISKSNVLLGYQIMKIPNTLHSENVCTIYDGGYTSSDEILGEAECVDNSKAGDWFAFPRVIEKQIYVHQGANTQVTLFFE